jgi:hypothetical protein
VARARSARHTALRESPDNDEVFTMRPDGSDLMNRTNHPAFDAAPDWQRLDDDDDDDDDEEDDGDDDRASDERE